ncbi:MAG: hypothetical protein OQL19_08470 [Gammaproteobacteria bacterium]|nr:hypothetical protein [Gammaproteobacteria bacterium]
MKKNLFFSEIKKICNLECWSVISGEGSGSHVSLEFGEKVPRNKPLSNPNLSDLSKKYTGKYSIFIEECSWRLESHELIICGSSSPNNNEGIMVNGLDKLIGKKVVDINIAKLSLDIAITFNDDLKLILFCNTINIEDGDNYTFFTPQKNFTAQGYGCLDIEDK